MGNAAPRAQTATLLDSASQYRTYLMDYNPRSMNIMFGSLIGDGKFLKTIYCKCDEGHLVVKIYRKYVDNESLERAAVSLRRIFQAFTIELHPNLIPYADYQLSAKHPVAFMVRQYFASNLYDRICSRPFLTMIEKKWIAYQILRALDQCHSKGICHGDIKQENIMVTSWNWIFLTDFAPFKPTYIPEDDPADYNYYFCAIDATRRGCSVAPERFYGKPMSTALVTSSGTQKGPDAMMLSRMADSELTLEEMDKQFLNGHATGSSYSASSAPSSAAGSVPSGTGSSRSGREGNLKESMDIFSAGCAIAEVFLGGKPLFELPTLLQYRRGDSEPLRNTLKKVGDPRLEEMLLHMLQLDPRARLSATEYLAKYTSAHGLFPTYFDNFLFRFLVLVLSRGGKVPDARIRLVCKYYGRLVKETAGIEDLEGEEFFKGRLKEGYGSDRQMNLEVLVQNDQQPHVVQRVLEELEQKIPSKEDKKKIQDLGASTMTKLQKLKEKENEMTGLSGTLQKKKIEKLHDQYNALTQKKKHSLLLDYGTPGAASERASEEQSESTEDSASSNDQFQGNTKPPSSSKPSTSKLQEPWSNEENGIVIILSLICSSLRHVQTPESKLTALYLLRSLGRFTSDEVRLQRLIPFLLEILDDSSAAVRALALRTLTYLLSLVESFPLSDANIFPQYILPMMGSFPSDPDEMVRIAFAGCLPQLAETSRRFLEISHSMKQKNMTSAASSISSTKSMDSMPANIYLSTNSFDKELNRLHKMFSRFVNQLTAPDQKASSSSVKRALMADITRLCVFFGRERTLDVVLPQLITFLNDRDWELRGAFFDYIVGVGSFVGRMTVELYILPCIEQALFDVQEIVITKALECLDSLCQLGLFQKSVSALVEKAKMTSSLLLHPSWWIRDAVLKLVTHIAMQMGSVDANVFLSPLLRPFLNKTMVFLLEEKEQDILVRLRDSCRPHVSRETFDAALIASSSSSGPNEIIMEMESFVSLMTSEGADSNTFIEETPTRRTRDALSSMDSMDPYATARQGSALSRTASAQENTTNAYERRKNEIQALKLMQQYVGSASNHMRSKMELAHSEQMARMQAHGKTDRIGGLASAPPPSPNNGGNPFAKKISRSHLRVLYVPDMRYALSVAQPIKGVNMVQPSGGSAPTSGPSFTSSASLQIPGTSTSLVVRQPGSNYRSVSSTGSSGNVLAALNSNQTGQPPSAQVAQLENLSHSLIMKMYGLVAPNLSMPSSPYMSSAILSSGSSAFDDPNIASGQSHVDLNNFAQTTGGVMISNLNMSMRDMYGGDGVGSLLDHPHQFPGSPSRQRTMKKSHSNYHHYFAFKESAVDPALGNARKLLVRLTSLGIAPLPPDLGALRLPDGTPYSIYSHPSSPYSVMHNGFNVVGTPNSQSSGSERNGMTGSVSGSATSSPVGGLYNAGSFGTPSGSGIAGSTTGSTNVLSTGGGFGPSYTSRNWRPRNKVLVAELAEHSGAVNRISAAQDYSFLASASNDGTVKLWSIRSMLHSVNQGSRCTYDGQGGVLTDMIVLDNSHSVAAASSNGTVHVFRVDKVNAVGGNFHATGLKEVRSDDGAVMVLDHLNNVTESLLIYATRNKYIHAWDLRMRQEAWKLEVSPELGYVTCMTHSLDVSWLAAGTSRGFICLWDLRFLVLIRIWRHSSHRAIHRLKPCLGLPNTLSLDETSVPLVFVAAGDGEVAVFDLSIGACRAIFRTLHGQTSDAEARKCPTLLHVPIPHRSRSVLGSFLGIYGIATAFDEIATTPLSEEPTVRAMLCPSLHLRGMGDALITGGEDRQIRYWDIRNGKQSYTICGNGESKSFYDNQAAPNDWWRMSSSSYSGHGRDTQMGNMSGHGGAPSVTKPEMAWSKLSPPIITICQDASYFTSQGGASAAAGGGGVESAVAMERRGLVPPSPAHNDCILDLTLVDLNGPMLVSSGRDGLIKVWK